MNPHPKKPSRPPVAGDVVVSPVSHHYHIGRVQSLGTVLSAIAVMNRREDALAQASASVTGHQRVFLYEDAGSRECFPVDCAKRR